MKKEFIITTYSENHIGLTNRITIIFTRRQVNIESLTGSESALPGIHKITIVVNEEEEKVEKKNYLRREYRSQSFVRKFALPMPVKADKAQADYERGVLKVTLPKAEEVKPKKIAVKMNK